jgi:hypothetical protein
MSKNDKQKEKSAPAPAPEVSEKIDLLIPPRQKMKTYAFSDYMSRWSLQFWKEFFKKNYRKRSHFLIIMHTRNGKYDMLTVATDQHYFRYAGGTYYIDPDMVREDIHTNLSSLYYHQDCASPIRIEINIDKLLEYVKENGDEAIVKALNPNSLRGFIDSQVIEKVLQGAEMMKDIKFMKLLIVLNLLISLIIGFMIAKSVGWF